MDHQMLAHLAYRVVCTAFGPIAIRTLQKQRLIDDSEDASHRGLQQPILDGRNTESADPPRAVAFGNLYAPYRRCMIALLPYACVEVPDPLFQTGLVVFYGLPVHSRRTALVHHPPRLR
jgi:hypothetical protein